MWAIDEVCLPNFLTPRDCLWIAYHVGKIQVLRIERFFYVPITFFDVVIESKRLDRMRNTTLYLYEFDTTDFELLDDVAGYYVAKTAQSMLYHWYVLWYYITEVKISFEPGILSFFMKGELIRVTHTEIQFMDLLK